MKNYTWNPQDYAQHSKAQLLWAQELIGKLKLQPHEHLLDIGCGDGKVTAEIAALVSEGSVVGVDSSPEMIKLAQSTFPPSDYPNCSFQVADARELSFGSQFDTVFSNAALHWVQGHAPVVKGISMALKPGGRMLLQMGGFGNARKVLDVLDEFIKHDPWRRYFDGFPFPYGFHHPDEYYGWLSQNNCRAVRVELIPKDMRHESIDAFKGWIRTTWLPYLERLPNNLHELFIDSITDNYLKLVPADADGTVHVDMVRLEVEAVRR